MVYLTYDEYKEIGGTLDLTAFNRNIDRACGIIDSATFGRVKLMRFVSEKVKSCTRDVVEYLHTNANVMEKSATSRSQSAGGVSESVSFKTQGDMQTELDGIIFDYLSSETDDYFTPLLYRGCKR